MTTKYEILEELKQFIIDKREEISTECDEEAMQWQEDAENTESEFYEISKQEYEKILDDKLNSDLFLDSVDDFLANI